MYAKVMHNLIDSIPGLDVDARARLHEQLAEASFADANRDGPAGLPAFLGGPTRPPGDVSA